MHKKPFISLVKTVSLGFLPFLALFGAWHIAYSLNENLHWLVPSPAETATALSSLFLDGTLLSLVTTSALNLFPPFFIAVACALIIGVALGTSKTLYKIFFPLIATLYPVPSLAWLPFIILIFGFSIESIWFVIFISSFMKMIYSVIGGVRSVSVEYVLAARNFEFSRIQTALRIVVPCALPQIMSGLRLGFGSAWRSLIAAEMLVVALGGLGKFIWFSQWFFSFEQVIAGIIIISIISLIFELAIFGTIEKLTLRKWGWIMT